MNTPLFVAGCLGLAVYCGLTLGILLRISRRPKSPAALTAEMLTNLDKSLGVAIRRIDEHAKSLDRAEDRDARHEEQMGTFGRALKSIGEYSTRSWQFVTDHADATDLTLDKIAESIAANAKGIRAINATLTEKHSAHEERLRANEEHIRVVAEIAAVAVARVDVVEKLLNGGTHTPEKE